MKYIGYRVLFFFSLCLISCHLSNHSGKKVDPLFQVIPSTFTGIDFNNELVPNDSLNILEYDYFYNGGGVAAADLNNDGLSDLYFTGNQVTSRLYINKGGLKFEDATGKAGVETTGWATGVSVADVNSDGLPDMYISFAGHLEGNRRKHKLFINKGNDSKGIPVFKDEAGEYGIADTSYTTQSSFFDYDKDGDPDLLLANHFRSRLNPNLPTGQRTNYIPESKAKLYSNEGGHFIDVSSKAGFKEDGYSLGVAISDINMDGWPDIYMAKDFVFDDALYINNGNGTFTENATDYISHTSRFSMGCDIADFNNDSYPDIVTLDMMPDDNYRQKLMNIAMNNDRFNLSLSFGYLPQYSRNMLQLNNGPGGTGQFSFSEIGQLAGIYKTDWSWCPLFADFDNDGFKDLFISNGIPRDITNNDFISYRADAIQHTPDRTTLVKQLLQTIEELKPVEKSNYLFRNNGNLLFSDMSAEWGMDKKGFFNGAVYADLDNDGDLDIITNNLNNKATLYKNTSDLRKENNYLRVQLLGSLSPGAKISVDCKGTKQWIEHYSTRGFQSSQDPVEHFGLGSQSMVDTIRVEWPDGKIQLKINVKANQLTSFDYKDAMAKEVFVNNNLTSSKLFKNITFIWSHKLFT